MDLNNQNKKEFPMPIITWSEKLETGISVIDSQHRVLVSMLNQIQTAAEEKDPATRNTIIKMDLQHLVEYTIYHFETEEKLMEEAEYSGLKEHKKAHENLRTEVLDYYDKFQKGEDVLAPLLSFLKYWLQGHIMKTDMDFVPAVKNNMDE
jgi:hemerythrin